MDKKPIRCVATYVGAYGPTLSPIVVMCDDAQLVAGEHYVAVRAYWYDDSRSDNAVVVFDEIDGPAWLFAPFEWITAAVISI